MTCSSRCARRSRQERREDQNEDKETNLVRSASGGVFEADEERSDADFGELQPWQPLKRLEMRRGALI